MARILEGDKINLDETSSLGEFFFNQAEKYRNNIFQINGETKVKQTFGSAKDSCTRLAISMKEMGVEKGDVVLLCIGNNENNAIPAIAALYLGAKVASLDPSLSVRDCKQLIDLVSPRIIFVEESAVHLIEQSIDVSAIQIVVVGESSKYLVLSEMQKPKENESTFRPTQVDCRETGVIFFSSGTTGLPKGIEQSHFSLISSAVLFASGTSGCFTVSVHFTSLYWVSAFLLMIISHYKGTTKIVCPKIDPENLFQLIEEFEISYAFLSPTLAHKLSNVENASKYNTSSLFSVTVSGTTVSVSLMEKIRKILPNSLVNLLYGMSEASIVSMFDYVKDHLHKEKVLSSGRLIPGVKCKIVDNETKRLLGPNEKGEICLLTRYIMNGYYKADACENFDEDNYLKTGDIGYYDDDGYLYVIDRLKEMFKYQSWHIVPASIQTIILEHPEVKEAIVIGVPHEEDGDHPAACVILNSTSKLTGKDIQNFVAERVIDRQKLRGGVLIVESIPKTPTGKTKRELVKKLFLENCI